MKGDNVLENIANGIKLQFDRLFHNRYRQLGFSWLRTRIVKNLPARKMHTIKFLNHQISFCSRSEFLHSAEEIFIDEIYKMSLKGEPYIIDCGANIGLSVIYLKKQSPGATIIAFEPDEKNFQLLQKNITAFKLQNVILRKEAVWKENTKISFSNDASQMSRISDTTNHTQNLIEVDAIRLKDFITKEIDFLKIDIEGAEYEVLKDIEPTLHFIQKIFLEYHGTFAQNDQLNEILAILSRQRFNYYIKPAADKHPTPFHRQKTSDYDVQLNIFCFRE